MSPRTPQSEESRVREEKARERGQTYLDLGCNHADCITAQTEFAKGWNAALKHSPTVLALVKAIKKYSNTPASYKYSSSLVRRELEAALSAYDVEINLK